MTSSKTPKSAVIIMPDEQSELWSQIQAIREKHDKSFVRWMPHINLLYPFLTDDGEGQTFQDAASKLTACLENTKPFTIKFSKESFGHFAHSKSCTLWLKPLQPGNSTEQKLDDGAAAASSGSDLPHHPEVLNLQRQLQATFPDCDELSKISTAGFQPHLSLGQFKAGNVKKFSADFQEKWVDGEFRVKEIYLISRSDFNDPFHIRHTVRLGGGE